MRVLRDVVIHRTNNEELQAVSHVPAVAGEEMTLDLMGAGSTLGLRVKVIDSRPMMVDGSVRHRIRLALLNGHAEDEDAPARREVAKAFPGGLAAEAI
jgi:hypothetical protein